MKFEILYYKSFIEKEKKIENTKTKYEQRYG
jgi:hypothetical protein